MPTLLMYDHFSHHRSYLTLSCNVIHKHHINNSDEVTSRDEVPNLIVHLSLSYTGCIGS
jgi:hypothetical protein